MIGGALAVAFMLLGSSTQDAPITGTRVATIEKDGRSTAILENVRDVAIEAVRIDEVDADGRVLASRTTDFCVSDPESAGPAARIRPHERRALPLALDRSPARVKLSVVLYDDLSFEGNAAARDDILRARAEQAYEYDFAIRVLKTVPSISPRGLEAYLAGQKADWIRQLAEQGKQPGGDGPLEQMLRQARESPERFIEGVARYREAAEAQVARLRRHLPPGGIAGARLTVVDKSARRLFVTLENRRDSPLVEWRIDSPWVSFGGRDIVPPHGSREVSIEIDDDRPATRDTTLEMAAFEDGYYEGRGRMFDQWVADRAERGADLAYWVDAFASMPRVSETELRAFLSDRVAARMSGETHMSMRHVSDRVQELMKSVAQGGSIWPRIERLRQEVEAEYRAVARQPSGARPGTVDSVTAAAVVRTELRPTVSYTVILENLRDVPIEAFAIEDYDFAAGRPSGWTGTDFCNLDPAQDRAGRGRIMPHEKRDLGAMFGPGPTVPLAKLKYVMFDDLQFEGDPVDRARLLRVRETRADEAAFALAALEEATEKPVSELEPFFARKRETWLRQLQRDGRTLAPGNELEWFIGNIRRTSAERFAADIPATRQRLEGEIARFRRHLASR